MSGSVGNCVLCALAAWVKRPLTTRLVMRRNRCGRWHVMWRRDGALFEFYAPGRSGKTYCQNLLYRGVVRKIGGGA